MFHRRPTLRSALVASAFVMAAGMGFQQTTPAWAGSDGNLVIAVTKLSTTLDPMGSNSNVNERVSNNLVETLIRYNYKTGALEPGLATSWKFVNPTTLELKLRAGVKCHDGENFDASDVAYMFGPARYNGEKAPGFKIAKQFLGTIKEVKAVDKTTVDVITYKPDPLLEVRLANWMSQVPCADAYKAAKSWEKWGQSVVGTGPYKLVEFKPGEDQKFERFDGYWGDKAPLKSFTLTVVPETAARVAGLFTGEYDLITEVPPDQIKTIDKNAGTEVVGGPINNIRAILYDFNNPALRDPRVRRALNLAIDRELIVKTLLDGKTVVPNGMQMQRFGQYYIADFKGAEYNPEKAKKLLKEAGYKGQKISYRYLQDYYTNEVSTAQVLAAMWKAVGLNVKLELKESWSQVSTPQAAKGRGIINWSHTAYWPDPTSQLWRQYGPSGPHQTRGWDPDGSFGEFNKVGEALSTETNPGKRRVLIRKLLELYEQIAPGTYLYVNPFFYGIQKNVDWRLPKMASAFMDFRAGSISLAQ